MDADQLRSLAGLVGFLLFIWELLKRHWAAASLSAIAVAVLLLASNTVAIMLSAILVMPIVFEERWHPRAEKDMMRGVLAAVVIAADVALFLVYRQ